MADLVRQMQQQVGELDRRSQQDSQDAQSKRNIDSAFEQKRKDP